jgi:putative phage-type endonuclease
MSSTQDKGIQTYEEDFLSSSEISSEVSSEISSEISSESLDMSDNEYYELSQTVYELLYDYMNDNILSIAKPNFMVEIVDDVSHIIFQHLKDCEIIKEYDYGLLYSFIDKECHEWFLSRMCYNCPIRHLPHTMSNLTIENNGENEEYSILYNIEKIENVTIKDKENHKQRTTQWYTRRYNMLTASNLWQALGSDAQRNRLIYEKCKPLEVKEEENRWISTEGALHWGVKYEPLTVLVYEAITGAKIGDFSCISHSKYNYIGASPDGIVVNSESPLFGRLVEIKNIYNRYMDGIPSDHYWIQMQIQMQCCEIDYCDFVETRFKEYDNSDDFYNEEDLERKRGIILEFIRKDLISNSPKYIYSDICSTQIEYNNWIEYMKSELSEDYMIFKKHYWYLDEIAMTTILRNDAWFNDALPKIKEVWDIILKERVSGYEHRAAKKRVPKEILIIGDKKISKNVCLIKLSEEETKNE